MNDVTERIRNRIDSAAASSLAVNDMVAGIKFSTMIEVMEFAKMMAVSGTSVPKHLRNNPGSCLAVCVQALEWKMSPFSVANKSYEVNDRIAYESQLIHAVVEARAPLKGRLRHLIIGEGDDRRIKVWGTFKGEDKAHEYLSPPLKDLRPGTKIKDGEKVVKGSPLWLDDPDTQLFYYGTRTWARMFCPDVLLGIYSIDEVEEVGPENARDVTPKKTALVERLKDRRNRPQRGAKTFDADAVAREADTASGPVIEGEATGPAAGGDQTLADPQSDGAAEPQGESTQEG